ncbi:hypothetical protein V8C86DRAFT_2725244 [Haematococcus lacustris]
MSGRRKAYIYPADSYLGQSLGPALKASGFEVLGGCLSEHVPEYLESSYRIGSPAESAAKKQFLALADVVVHEMHGHEQAARDAVVHMNRQPFGGRHQLYLGVSTPLVWAATRPAPPLAPEEEAVCHSDAGEAEEQAGHSPMTTPPATLQRDTVANSQSATSRPVSAAPLLPPSASHAAVYAAAEAVGALTDRDAGRRAPCLMAHSVHDLELLITRSQRKGRLRTVVVCPGLMYGRGEDDELLHPLMRTAWEVTTPLMVYAAGSNYLPMVHVADAAAYLVALASPPGAGAIGGLPDSQQYLLVTDSPGPGQLAGVTQAELAKLVSERLGDGRLSTLPAEELLFATGLQCWTLDLKMLPSPLPAAAGYSPTFSAGLRANLEGVVQDWLKARGVTPLRIVVAGPPMSGKSVLAARLAAAYGLPCVCAQDLLTEAALLAPEDAKALAAEMSGKEPRASNRSMSLLARALLSNSKGRLNRGYVLDGWPRSGAAAKWMFMSVEPMTAEELAERHKDEAFARGASPSKGGKDKAKPSVKKEGGLKKGVPGSEPDVPDGFKLVPSGFLAPTHLIELSASEEELLSRMRAVEAAELEAAAAATPTVDTPPPAAKGKPGTKGASQSLSHNNDKDFARRMEAWARMKADDAEELSAKVAAVTHTWARVRAEAAQERARAAAEAATLRAKRRKAKEAAAAAAASITATGTASSSVAAGLAGGDVGQGTMGLTAAPVSTIASAFTAAAGAGTVGGVPSQPSILTPTAPAPPPSAASPAPHAPPRPPSSSSNPLPTPDHSPLPTGSTRPISSGSQGVGVGDTLSLLDDGGESQAEVPPGLPQHGGLAGVLVEACGAALLRLENPDLEGGTPGSLAAQKELQLPVLQAQVMALVGAPHNFVGFPAADAPGLHESEARLPSASSLTQLGGEGAAAALPPPLDDAIIKQQAQESYDQAALAARLQHAFAGDPIRSYLMKEVMPAVTEALRLIARDRPRQPLRFLGHHLLQEANKHEAMVVDPYDHPSYQEHVVKLMDKQQRDQARAVAAAEKAQKELAAKLAAKAAAMDGVQ